MNAAFAALGPAPASPAGSSPTPTLAQRTKQLRRDQPQLAALLPSGGSSGSGALGRAGAAQAGAVVPPQAGPGGNYSWGSSAMPWEVAAAGQAFVRDQVRVESALLYIRRGLGGGGRRVLAPCHLLGRAWVGVALQLHAHLPKP